MVASTIAQPVIDLLEHWLPDAGERCRDMRSDDQASIFREVPSEERLHPVFVRHLPEAVIASILADGFSRSDIVIASIDRLASPRLIAPYGFGRLLVPDPLADFMARVDDGIRIVRRKPACWSMLSPLPFDMAEIACSPTMASAFSTWSLGDVPVASVPWDGLSAYLARIWDSLSLEVRSDYPTLRQHPALELSWLLFHIPNDRFSSIVHGLILNATAGAVDNWSGRLDPSEDGTRISATGDMVSLGRGWLRSFANSMQIASSTCHFFDPQPHEVLMLGTSNDRNTSGDAFVARRPDLAAWITSLY